MTEQATQAGAEECAGMGETAEAHEKFKPFVGTFAAQVKMWMGPGDPMESTGTMTNTLELGGRFLQQQYKGDPGDGPFPNFEGKGFWGYNTATNKYEGLWIDTATTQMQTEQGEVDSSGKVWTMVGEARDPHGKPFKKKSIIKLIDTDHHTMEMYFSTPQGEQKGMEINYTRKA